MKSCLNCRRPNYSKFKRCARCREVARAYFQRHRKEAIKKSRAYRKTHLPQLAAQKRAYRWRKRVEVLWEQYWAAARALVAGLASDPRPVNNTKIIPEVTK